MITHAVHVRAIAINQRTRPYSHCVSTAHALPDALRSPRDATFLNRGLDSNSCPARVRIHDVFRSRLSASASLGVNYSEFCHIAPLIDTQQQQLCPGIPTIFVCAACPFRGGVHQ